MKKVVIMALGLGLAGIVSAGQFADVDSAKYHGKTSLKELTEVLDANFAIIEGGSLTIGDSAVLDSHTINRSE
jgi:hypothetical protein